MMVLNSGRNGKLKMTQSRIWSVVAAAVGLAGSALPALAQDSNTVLGAPHDKGIGLQAPATVLAEEIDFLHNVILMPIITVITLFVLGLLFVVWFRFRESKNPVPSKNTHNTGLEVAWTIIPVLILVVIAVFSFPLLYQQLEIPTPGLTIRAIGHQWYWAYEYPDNGNFTFDARVVAQGRICSRARSTCSTPTTKWCCRSTPTSASRSPASTSSTPGPFRRSA